MRTRRTLYILGFCIAIFAVSLVGTIVARSQPPSEEEACVGSPLARWLDLDKKTADEIGSHDPQFSEDLKSLQRELAGARSALATLLEDENATNERIRGQVENCIAKHNAQERRVAQYLLTVRDHLTPVQQKKLFRLCAEGVRKGRGHGWGRRADHASGGGGRCECCGRGGGGGRGHGGERDDG
ncbi:MAG: hypothetical protein WBE26_13495 [Phycisphaerae bacterium]